MWRKTTEAKPNPAASKTPGPASSTETPKQTQAAPQQASTTPAVASTPAVNQPSASGAPTAPAQASQAATAPAEPLKTSSASAAPQGQPPAPAPQPVRAEASTISAGLKIKGEITGTSDLTIDGETQGKVRLTNGRVTVGPSGRVIADIDARDIVVHGTVQGNLKATDSVRLGSSGHVEGSILTARIGIEDGARLRGNVEMIRPGQAQDSTPAQAARAATASNGQDSD